MGTKAKLGTGLLALGLLAAACGDDTADESAADGEGTEDTTGDTGGGEGGEATQNACPADGCQISFASVAPADDELEVTWDINFDPEVAGNHIHIYWDTYDPEQVSNDAADRGVDQGEWVPTDSMPTYVTDGAASTSVRGDSTTLCVVAADRDHNILDAGAEVCQDVSEHLT